MPGFRVQCWVQGRGGGMYDVDDSGATQGVLRIQMCHFTDNTAGRSGGGVDTSRIDSLTISGSTFSANCAR